MKKEAHVYYSGRVQGVGFRFTAEDLAKGLSIAGFVRNLSDGRVEIVAQAEEDTLKNFLDQVQKAFSSYIRETNISWQIPAQEYKDFGVKF